MSDRELACKCVICSVPDTILNLPSKLAACPLERDSVVYEEIVARFPLADARIIKQDFAWVHSCMSSICAFATDMKFKPDRDVYGGIARRVAGSLLPFAVDVALDSSMSRSFNIPFSRLDRCPPCFLSFRLAHLWRSRSIGGAPSSQAQGTAVGDRYGRVCEPEDSRAPVSNVKVGVLDWERVRERERGLRRAKEFIFKKCF